MSKVATKESMRQYAWRHSIEEGIRPASGGKKPSGQKGKTTKRQRARSAASRFGYWFLAVFALFSVVQVILPTGAGALTAAVLPNGDVTTEWARCNNSSCGSARYTYIDEDVADLNLNDYINTGTTTTSGASAAVEFDMTTITQVASVSNVMVNLSTYIATQGGGQADTLSVQLRIGGNLTTAVTVSPTTGWFSQRTASFSGSWSQSDLDGMRVRITRNTLGSGGNSNNWRDDVRIAALSATVTYASIYSDNMSAYRWMDTSRNPLGATNTPVTLGGVGTPFRLRSSIHMSSTNSSATPVGNKSYRLEYAERVGTCDPSFTGETYQSIAPGLGDWELKTSTADFGNRSKHAAITFDNKIWVMGGWNGSTFFNDVWYSSDGANWTRATSSAGWSPRYEFEALVYDNKMWVIGGYASSGGDRRDVWYSSDGATWTQATSTADWSARYGLGVAVYDNKMWVMGGFRTASGGTMRDVWYSTNGVNWTQATSSANWPGRTGHAVLTYDNKMWVMGGLIEWSHEDDVWHSTDGVNWTQATAAADWPARTRIYQTSEVFADRMFILGGTNGSVNYDDVWSSSNGADWDLEFDDPGWPPMQEAATAVLGNALYITGGDTGSGIIDDVWAIDLNSPVVSYYDDPGIADGSAISSVAGDPSHGHTIVYQTYVESDGFTNTNSVPSGQDAMWEFSLMTSANAPADTTYCIRIAEADGTPLDTYSVIAEIATPPPHLNQASMRWYDSGASPLQTQNTHHELSPPGGDALRMRMLIAVTQIRADAASLSLKLQYAPKVGTCDVGFVGESYVDFTTSGSNSLSFYDNAGITHGSAITANGNDPTYAGFTASPQNFIEQNNFSNVSELAVDQAGLWEFSIINNLQEGARYCIRVVHADGTPLDTYTSIPELWVPPGMSQLMRHGRFFDANQSGGSFMYWQ